VRLGEYLDEASEEVRGAVAGCLDAMAACGGTWDETSPAAVQRMAENLWADHRPPREVWADLCERLTHGTLEVEEVCVTIREWGRAGDHAFVVPVACLGPRAVLAHFIPLERLANDSPSRMTA
jgi:hypothetical protein